MTHRVEKVVSQMERLLAEWFLKYAGEKGIGIVSISGIVISRDLSSAKVWVSFIGQKVDSQASFKKLTTYTSEIQSFVFKQMAMKKVPKIFWKLDEHPEQNYRIEEILDDIKRTQKPNSEI